MANLKYRDPADGLWKNLGTLYSQPPPPTQQVFTASGTWTKPTNALYCVIEVQGGGGAGGGAATSAAGQHTVGAGGASGGYSRSTILASGLGATETVTVGAGGAGVSGAAGSAGAASSFGTWVAAVGGGGGATTTTSASAFGTPAGGIGAGTPAGDIMIGPAFGENGWGDAAFAIGGNGGDSAYGSGGRGYTSVTSPGQGIGLSGYNYGSGGGGSAVFGQAGTAQAGGAGANGVVIVTTYYTPSGGPGGLAAFTAVAAGSLDIVSPGSEVSRAGTVTFPAGRFAAPPYVTANLVIATTNMLTNVSSVTASGFTVTVFHKTAGANITAATYTVHWIAVAGG